MQDPQRGEDDLARLRARLYRPDATAEDLRRYEAAVATLPVRAPERAPELAEPDSDEEEAPPPPPRRRRRVLVAVVAAGAIAALAGIAVALQTASPTLIAQPVPTGLRGFTVSPEEPVVDLPQADGAIGQTFRGRGPGTASLRSADFLGAAEGFELRITVGASSPIRWAARRVEIRLDGDQYVRVLAARSARQLHGVPVTYAYTGTPPTSIRIEVPDGVPWDLRVQPPS